MSGERKQNLGEALRYLQAYRQEEERKASLPPEKYYRPAKHTRKEHEALKEARKRERMLAAGLDHLEKGELIPIAQRSLVATYFHDLRLQFDRKQDALESAEWKRNDWEESYRRIASEWNDVYAAIKETMDIELFYDADFRVSWRSRLDGEPGEGHGHPDEGAALREALAWRLSITDGRMADG